ncbi:dephospho-CoA kinase [Pantoea sp. Mhis]|uniref:dephospho-CoA kinase n=1 Tax=Pantoea sp. Mhis TaxID=2576759 RepID=UPI00135B26AD|nr:dephospho-CoA kinase [Pantoea sp. Mhis]MXP56504.1 dephospho-CoA kinase [Pantoea sp. Mhis]
MSFEVALTGGIGSGKSTITKIFKSLGVNIIDADIIAKEIVKQGSNAFHKIVKHYNKSILTKEGTLNRSKLRDIIFYQPEERYWLNNLLHPLIQLYTQKIKTLTTSPYILWIVPLLLENNLQHLVDRVLIIDVDENTQIQRAKKRDKVHFKQIENIIEIQSSREYRLTYANDIIDNNGSLKNILPQVIALHQYYLRLSEIAQD